MSDDNTSESEASSIHGLLFNEDEQQAFKVEEFEFLFVINRIFCSVMHCTILVVQHVLQL
jgi:hypothetical protein